MGGGHHPERRSQACQTWELTEAAGERTSRVLGKGPCVQSSRVVRQSTPNPPPQPPTLLRWAPACASDVRLGFSALL